MIHGCSAGLLRRRSFDPALRRLGLISGTAPSIVTWLAPVGSLLTGQAVLANQQHVRFISGVSTVTPPTVTLEVLRGRIAGGFYEEFRRRTDIAVTAVVLDQAQFVPFASVRDGVLRVGVNPIPPPPVVPSPLSGGGGGPFVLSISVPPAPQPAPQTVRVAWVVDTGVVGG